MTDSGPLMLAAGDIDEWVRIGILILVFGGSTLAAVGKKLIDAFGGKKGADQPVTPDKAASQETQPVGRPTPPPVAKPVAMPPVVPPPAKAPRVPVPSSRPLGAPVPARPAQPVSDKRVAPAVRRGRPERRHPKQARPTRAAERHVERLQPAVSEHLGHLKPSVAARSEHVAASVERRVGHLATKPDSTRTRVAEQRLGPLTRGNLRRAIILNEILSPPLALRSPEV